MTHPPPIPPILLRPYLFLLPHRHRSQTQTHHLLPRSHPHLSPHLPAPPSAPPPPVRRYQSLLVHWLSSHPPKNSCHHPTILKKSSRDPSLLSSYRPISNLSFLSKVLERVVASQLRSFLSRHSLFEPLQSGFHAAHSPETALVKVTNDILNICDQGSLCLLVLLNLSSAFDTVNHSILIHRLSALLIIIIIIIIIIINLRGSAWFDSCLSHCLHFVASNGFSSSPRTVTSGVPEDSVLGPLLFNIYMLPLGDIIHRHGVNFHTYADDTQLYLSASTLNSRTTAVLTDCLSDIKSWMRANFLQLNVDKTEALLIGSRQRLSTSGSGSINLHGCTLQLTKSVRNLGVLFDPQRSLLPHIQAMTHSAFPHLCKSPNLCHYLTPQAAETLVHAFITSRLDYANVLLVGLSNFPTPRSPTHPPHQRRESLQPLCSQLLEFLPQSLRLAPSLASFKSHFKTLLFDHAIGHPPSPPFPFPP
uniref:Reverse transcriptase domain-containing protein n=1 Tax=Callorhinchus milii TaxID=7868 RepID=A0A4W3J5N3_CALMI